MEASVTNIKASKKQAARAPEHALKPAIIVAVPIQDIDESPTQPRRTFLGLAELAEDIKKLGVLQHGLARPSPPESTVAQYTGQRYELVFGARRFRAAKLAGLTEFPLEIRQLSDAEVFEIQLAENSNRKDVHPLEEADGYRAGMERHGWSLEEVAAKAGKSVATVQARLKLCALVPEAREAFMADRITAAVALLLARVPNADVQREALAEVLPAPGEDPMSAKDASWEIRSKFMLRLVDAPFSRTDPALVPSAGSCAACPKRTGKQPELFSDVGTKEDLCTDSKCFGKKKDAAWEQKVAEAKTKEQTVLSEREAKKIFPHGNYLDSRSGYVDLSADNYEGGSKPRKNKTLIGKADIPIVIARDDLGGIHELVAKEDFARATKGSKAAAAVLHEGKTHSQMEKERRAGEAKQREKFEEKVALVVGAAEAFQPAPYFWRTLAVGLVRVIWADSRKDICRRRKIEITKGCDPNSATEKALEVYVEKSPDDVARGLCVEIVCTSGRGINAAAQTLKEFTELYGERKAPRATKKKTAKKSAKPARGGKR